jgi:hypothetical protein
MRSLVQQLTTTAAAAAAATGYSKQTSHKHTATMLLRKNARAILGLIFLVSSVLVNWAQAFDIDMKVLKPSELDRISSRPLAHVGIYLENSITQRERHGEPEQPPVRSKVSLRTRESYVVVTLFDYRGRDSTHSSMFALLLPVCRST